MRQGETENITNYIKRYEDLHIRLQLSLVYMEETTHVKKFIRSLKSEIELILFNDRPTTLKTAFAEAQLIDKNLHDNESLRTRKNFTPRSDKPRLINKPHLKNESSAISQNPPERKKLTREEREEKYFCKNCNKRGHTDSRYDELHPELKRNFLEDPQLSNLPNANHSHEQHFSSEEPALQSSLDTW